MKLLLFFLASYAGAQTITCSPANCVTGAGGHVTLTASSSVSWALVSGSVGSLSATSGTSTVYTAPSTIDEAHASVGGCMIQPNDSVFNTRIDNLPVNANSSSWISAILGYPITFVAAWDTNVIDNTVNTIASPQFYYSTQLNGQPFPLPNSPSRKRESGGMSSWSTDDHHMVTVNHQTCQFTETYHDYDAVQGISMGGVPGAGCNQGQGIYQGCDFNSGNEYSATSYAGVALPSVDAGNLELQPLTGNAWEVRAGAINHALRLTTDSGECGTPSGSPFLWPAQGTEACGTTGAMPMGARIRMKANATCPSTAAAAVVYCTALKQYGAIETDITSGYYPQITLGLSNFYDPAVGPLFNGFSIPIADMEFVDESSLEVSSTSYATNPNNGYVTPSNAALVSVNGGAVYKSIALQPVTVGVTEKYLTMPSGQTFIPTAWVNGTSTTTVNWTATGGGSFSGNTYTAPTLSPGGSASVTLKGCSSVDSAACDSIYLTVLPVHCQSADTTVRMCIDSASTTSYGPDANGDTWSPDTVVSGGNNQTSSHLINQSVGWSSETDGTPYETWYQALGDLTYNLVGLPAGNYKVTIGQGIGYNGQGGPPCAVYGSFPSTYGPFLPNQGPHVTYVSTQGTLILTNQDPGLPNGASPGNGYMCFQRSTFAVPAVVTSSGALQLTLNYVGNDTIGGDYSPSLSTLKIEADSTAPHLSIDMTGYSDAVRPGATVQMTALWWYLTGTATWSVSGPGSINSSGLYTAPSSQAVTAPAIVTVSDGAGHTATQTLYVQGVATPAAVY